MRMDSLPYDFASDFIKTNINKCLIILLLLVALFSKLIGQTDTKQQEYYAVPASGSTDEPSRIGLVSVFVGMRIPQNNFRSHLPKNQFDIGGNAFYQLKGGKPSFLGFEIDYSAIESFSAPVKMVIDFGTVDAQSTTSSNIVGFNLLYRHYPNISFWKLEPFIEGAFGANWFYTATTISSESGDESSTSFNKNDLVMSYGIAGGFNVQVNDSGYIVARVGYFPGLSGHYFTFDEDKGDPVESTIESFSVKKSTTDAIKINLGYTFAF